MAENPKNLPHIVYGSVPKEELDKFLRTHFKPKEGKVSPEQSKGGSGASSICASLGCPITHPISGTALNGCSVVTEHDGSTTIYCHYEPVATRY